MFRLSCAYARLQYFALAVCLLATLAKQYQFLSSWLAYAESWVGVRIILNSWLAYAESWAGVGTEKKKFRPWLNFSNPPPTVSPTKRKMNEAEEADSWCIKHSKWVTGADCYRHDSNIENSLNTGVIDSPRLQWWRKLKNLLYKTVIKFRSHCSRPAQLTSGRM